MGAEGTLGRAGGGGGGETGEKATRSMDPLGVTFGVTAGDVTFELPGEAMGVEKEE